MNRAHQFSIAAATGFCTPRAGALRLVAGRAWVTLDDGQDHVLLAPGQALALPRGARVVAEAWQRTEGATLAWQPQPRRGWRGLAAALAARALRGAAGALAAWARSAEAMARRSQGCMAAGESMASSGAVQ